MEKSLLCVYLSILTLLFSHITPFVANGVLAHRYPRQNDRLHSIAFIVGHCIILLYVVCVGYFQS